MINVGTVDRRVGSESQSEMPMDLRKWFSMKLFSVVTVVLITVLLCVEHLIGRMVLLSAWHVRADQAECRQCRHSDVKFISRAASMQWRCIVTSVHIYLLILHIVIVVVIILIDNISA